MISFKGNTAITINLAFQTLLITYLVLLLVEQIWPGLISFYLNLNYLLIAVIALGVFDIFSEKPARENTRPKNSDYIFVIALAILGFAIIKYKTFSLGWLSWIISSIAGILIFLLSVLIMEDSNA